ncbi:MAG: hypothetical protein WC421_05805 [Elusimicrobiales bacterium]
MPCADSCRQLRKGRALKTGFDYFLANFGGVPGIVTADADGQHRPEDILRIANAMGKNPGCLVLGTRAFSGYVPLRSLLGNIISRFLFGLAGVKVSDTQTGLRGIPADEIPGLLRLGGERYEFETAMLFSLKCRGVRFVEENIATVYADNNNSSHFNPLKDSMKVYS